MKCVPDKLQLFKWSTGYNTAYYIPAAIVDDVRVYDHALSEHEVRDLAKGLAVNHKFNNDLYDAARYISGTPVGDVGFTTVDGRNCAVFSSAGKRMDIEPFSAPKATLAFWYKRDDAIAAANWRTVLGCSANIHPAIFSSGSNVFGLFDGSFRESGYISPDDGKAHLYVTVIHGNGNASFYVDGNFLSTVATSLDLTVNPINRIGDWAGGYWAGVVGEVSLYAGELSAADIKNLYHCRGSIDDQGNFYAAMINDTGIKQSLLLDYTQWEDGQIGDVGMFRKIGSAGEDYRVIDTDPWGKPTVVWEARPDAVSGPDGGWNSDWFPVDPTKFYRLSTWVRRTVTGNGTFYFGCYGSPAVLNRSNGATNGNPYFDYRGGLDSEWILVVGHIWPIGSGAGAVHPDSGVYTVAAGRIANVLGNTGGDCVFAEGTTAARHRSYLYYSTDVNTRQQWCYPRMDICDGTEPSIAELLAGFDSRNEALFRAKAGAMPGQVISTVASGAYSEVGITDGLVAYYPLTANADDYSGNGHHGVANGAVPVAGGFDGKGAFGFSGDGQFIRVTSAPLSGGTWQFPEATFTFWVKPLPASSSSDQNLLTIENTFEIAINNSGLTSMVKYASAPWAWRTVTSRTLQTGTWHMVAYVHASSSRRVYIDGTEAYLSLESGGLQVGSPTYPHMTIGGRYAGGASPFFGDMANLKIFNRALTPEEIAIEYQRTGPNKVSISEGRTFIQGQFKEVIA